MTALVAGVARQASPGRERTATLTYETDPAPRMYHRKRTARLRRRKFSAPVRWSLTFGAGFLFLVAAALGFAYVRLASHPFAIPGLNGRIADAIAGRIGSGWRVTLQGSAIQIDQAGSLALRASGLEIRNPQGAVAVHAPLALVGVDPLALAFGSVQPRSIDFRDLQLRALLNRDGSLAFAASPEAAPEVVAGSPPVASEPGAPGRSPIASAVASLFDAVLAPAGLIGSLDRARLTNARLVVLDEEGRERAVFSRMDARFDRGSAGARHFDMRLEGPHGPWQLAADLREDAGENRRDGVITLTDVPVVDALLLSGLSGVPATTDLKISARANALFVAGRLARLDGHAGTRTGTVELDDKDFSPIPVDGTTLEASWDEAGRKLEVHRAAFEAGETRIALQGELVLTGSEGWRLDLSGENARLNGAGGDSPIAIDRIETRLSSWNGGIRIDRLALAGPMLSAALEGSMATEADRGGVTLRLEGSETSARTALRLWPEGVAKSTRGFLVETLAAGTVERLELSYAVSGPELSLASRGGLVRDDALRVDLTVREGEIGVAEGLPPLTRARVEGVITGRTSTIRQTAGGVRMPDGRSLGMSDGVFQSRVTAPRRAFADVSFRLEGGADAFAALLQSPVVRKVADVDLDPEFVKGRVDLAVGFPIELGAATSISDLALKVSGTMGDLVVEKAFGRERLEGGNLALSYDANGLAIRGEGRVAGAPAAIEMRQHGGAGDASVSMVLDEAARARKGLSFGSQLTGPLPVRIAIALGGSSQAPSGKPPVRVEADLSKVAIDNLIPGWTKGAGKPGKLSFTTQDGTELRDIALDSGTVAVRGSANFSPDGVLERADLTTFKLSPGDDMRVQAERSNAGYRVVARGNVADAQPLLRVLTGPSGSGTGGASRPQQPSRDIDLDVGINILTGFNDEALTNTTFKASLQGGRELRQLTLQGRLRSAPVSAAIERRDRGKPLLTVQSEDAGATLRFLDIYRRMVGGQLAFSASVGEGPQTGAVTIDSFALRNEPALRNIAQQSQAALPNDRARGSLPQLESNEVAFTGLKANLVRSGTRVEFSEAVIWGMQVGFTLAGWVDVARDRAEVSGTFVPAYGLNNVFAQVPLIGPLLGGGQHEGLFAVNFRVSGVLSSPTLMVNPLSAVAPGFLRKIFGYIPPAPDTTGATARPIPRVGDR